MKNSINPISLFSALLCIITFSACSRSNENTIKYEYGVFLGASENDIEYMQSYRKIILDAQYFSKEEIEDLKRSGHTVYSYINVGAIENFRPYYEDNVKFTLDVYENWEEEKWVDVSQTEWQDFIVDNIASDILKKGVDGLFVDNADVYYHYPNKEIFDGMTSILKRLENMNTYVIINGGDEYVTKYLEKNGTLDGVMDAVNQETIFSKINWDDDTFSENDESEKEYFKEYAELVSKNGKDVYLLEYTNNAKLIEQIDKYCSKNGFTFYASSTLELLAPASEKGSQKIKTPSDKK